MIDVAKLIREGIEIINKNRLQNSLYYLKEKYEAEHKEDVACDNGVSKFVFLGSEEDDFVIKINTSKYDDFCKLEYEVCQKAVEQGLSEMFAKCEIFGEVEGITLYKQEKVDEIDSRHSKDKFVPHEERDRAYKLLDKVDWSISATCWVVNVIKYYGEEKAEQLVRFLKENEVTDLHADNVGYIGERPVLLDYSGYHS